MRILLIVAGLFLSLDYGWTADDAAARLEAEMEKELASVDDPVWKLQSSYLKALKRLEEKAIESGNLDNVLLVRKEIAEYRSDTERDYSDFQDLEGLRNVYVASLEEKRSLVQRMRAAIYKSYSDKYAEVTKQLTIAGNLEQAVKANERQKQLTAKVEVAMKAAEEGGVTQPARKVLWEMKGTQNITSLRQCEVKESDGAWALSSPERFWSRVQTDVKLSPPFEIVSRAQTDSTNIRFYLGDRVITIFNWEVNKSELRIHNPVSGKQHTFQGEGYLKENEWHDIRIVVGVDKLSVYSDGEFRGEIEGEFAKLNPFVGIGPGAGSIVKLQRFAILEVAKEE